MLICKVTFILQDYKETNFENNEDQKAPDCLLRRDLARMRGIEITNHLQ